ncbi:hypothetical protein V6O07_04915 [Arthrospira platensis SPKY2]
MSDLITKKSLRLLRNNNNSIQSLYNERCTIKDGLLKPHFWKPINVSKDPFSLWGTDDLIIEDENKYVEDLMSRIIATGLNLELPVAEFIQCGIKTELPSENVDTTIKLLKSNACDEGSHYKGFKLLQSNYYVNPKHLDEAYNITNQWTSFMNKEYPLMISQLIEVGVFLITLGIMRLLGGKSFAKIAYGISEDEVRHIATSRTICHKLNYDPSRPPNSILPLVNQTLDFILEPINKIDLKEYIGFELNKDFFIKCSQDLISTGFSYDLNDLVTYSESFSPFELENNAMYDRVTSNEDLDELLKELA